MVCKLDASHPISQKSKRKGAGMNQPQFLTIAEKREWLARIFRDTSGEYSDADKFKVLREDNRLAMLSKFSTGKEQENG